MSEQYWGCLDKMSEVYFSPAETLTGDTVWAQLLLQFYTDSLETSLVLIFIPPVFPWDCVSCVFDAINWLLTHRQFVCAFLIYIWTFFVKYFSETTWVRILKFGTKLDSDELNCVTKKTATYIVLVHLGMTCPNMTEICWLECKESKQQYQRVTAYFELLIIFQYFNCEVLELSRWHSHCCWCRQRSDLEPQKCRSWLPLHI